MCSIKVELFNCIKKYLFSELFTCQSRKYHKGYNIPKKSKFWPSSSNKKNEPINIIWEEQEFQFHLSAYLKIC